MRGKITYRNGLHQSRQGGILDVVHIGNGEWREIENVLGQLGAQDRENIEEYCAVLVGIANDKQVASADVRETLGKIVKEKIDADVVRAFANCDSYSETLLTHALYQLDGPAFASTLPTLSIKHQAAKLRAAAEKASRDFKPSKGASFQGWQRNAAEYAIQLAKWRGVYTPSHSFDDDPESASAVVRLLLTLLGIVKPVDSPQSVSWCVKLLGEINARTA